MFLKHGYLGLLFTVLLISVLHSNAISGPSFPLTNSVMDQDVGWLTYTDPKLDISIEYPATWIVTPRNDNGKVGATLSFMDGTSGYFREESDLDSSHKVEIGMYLVEGDPNKSLYDWTSAHLELSKISEYTKFSSFELHEKSVDDYDSLLVIGSSPVTFFRFTNILRGKIVWFIWSNITDSEKNIYDYMVNSFKFGQSAPLTLQQVYGEEFNPFPMMRNQNETKLLAPKQPDQDQNLVIPMDFGSWWHAPLIGTSLTATCNSGAHDTSWSRYAIDVARPQGTSIYASSSDTVTYADWSEEGYGNLVRTEDGNKAYYAHMYAINLDLIYSQDWYVYRGDIIGEVGNTGNSSGNHLHLEVRTLSNASVRLNGMTGWTPTTSDYEYPDNPCGSISYP